MKFAYLLPVALGFGVIGAAAAYAATSPPSFTAVVANDGTLARGYRALSARKLSAGRYEVTFARSVAGCSYTASVGLAGSVGVELSGIANVASKPGKIKSIVVQTYTPDGIFSDRGFHVIVAC